MVMKVYSPEFKADAVALFHSDPDLTIAQTARDLGLNAETLRNWMGAFPLEGRSRLTCSTTAEAQSTRAAAQAASWVGKLRLPVDAQVIGSLKKKRTLIGA